MAAMLVARAAAANPTKVGFPSTDTAVYAQAVTQRERSRSRCRDRIEALAGPAWPPTRRD
jgi:hypothetical protein